MSNKSNGRVGNRGNAERFAFCTTQRISELIPKRICPTVDVSPTHPIHMVHLPPSEMDRDQLKLGGDVIDLVSQEQLKLGSVVIEMLHRGEIKLPGLGGR